MEAAKSGAASAAPNPDLIPAELKSWPQWVTWRWGVRDGKRAKVPASPATGQSLDPLVPANWRGFEDALRSLSSDYADGIGFVFSEDDPFCGFDLDDCRNPESGAMPVWAWDVVRAFGTYTEISPSGEGVKGFVRGRLPGKGGPKNVGGRTVELYDRKRFFAVTGDHLEGTPKTVAEGQAVLDELLPDAEQADGWRTAEPVPEKLGPGSREPTLFSVAGTLHRRGLGTEEIYAALRAVNEERCDPPKGDEEVRRIAEKVAERSYEADDLSASGGGAASDGKPTHDELADRWLAKHPGERAHGQGEWKRYEGGIWLPVPDAAVKKGVKAVLVAAKAEEIKPTAALLASVVELARVEVVVPDEEWDADPDILVCANGTLHVPTRSLREHRKGDHATSSVPYDYDPEALAPTWGRFLGDFVDAETAHFLQEFAGYALTTDVSHELALWVYGPPGGGRSTFIAGMEAMLGERVGTLGLRGIERSQFALANVPGKTLLTATEQPAGFVRSSDVLNALISGDGMEVEKKYKPAYRVYPRAKLLWAMNDLPRLKSANDGLFRRVKVIRIEPVPEGQRDPKVKDGIKEEGAGILNWALDGLARLRERGGFQVPDSVKDATGQWQTTNDTAALFVAEECERAPGERTRANALYRRYRSWCEENGHRPKAHTNIAEDWERLGFERLKSGGRTYWLGVRVRDPVVMHP